MINLKNGVAVITGAGSGLGRALTLKLCEEGCHVVGLGRRSEALEQTRLTAAPQMFHPYTVDISDPASVREVVASVVAIHGPITILINNAAVKPHKDFLDETAESFLRTVEINLGGTVVVTRAVLDNMLQTGFGRILNVSSFAGDDPIPTSGAYSVSKGAQRILSQALVADLADRFPDIVINTWMPGMLATEMGTHTGLSPDDAAVWGAKLALAHDRALMGTTFEMNQEVLPGRSLRRKLKDIILFRRPKPRQL